MSGGMTKLSLLFLVLYILLILQSLVECFSIDLIHRDSPQSPLYDPSLTKWDRLNAAFRRSASRKATLNKLSSNSRTNVQTQLDYVGGEYLIRFYIGNPPIPQFAIADTGSDLTWVQCKPCKDCFIQPNPTFQPKNSKTYGNINCNTPLCKSISNVPTNSSCDPTNTTSPCNYAFMYANFLRTSGNIGSETFTFKSASGHMIPIPEVAFGCATQHFTNFSAFKADGIFGLGRGKVSFINQASKHVSRKFSYCLPPNQKGSNATTSISFGDSAQVGGPGAVTIPLKIRNDTFYTITIESVLVNGVTISLTKKQKTEGRNGDVIVDLGTDILFLPVGFYKQFLSEVKKTNPNKGFEGPMYSLFGNYLLCYKNTDKIVFPKITLKFEGGGEMELPNTSIYKQINQTTVCLAIVPNDLLNNPGVIGNLAQANSVIGFDLDKNIFSIKSSDCAKS